MVKFGGRYFWVPPNTFGQVQERLYIEYIAPTAPWLKKVAQRGFRYFLQNGHSYQRYCFNTYVRAPFGGYLQDRLLYFTKIVLVHRKGVRRDLETLVDIFWPITDVWPPPNPEKRPETVQFAPIFTIGVVTIFGRFSVVFQGLEVARRP